MKIADGAHLSAYSEPVRMATRAEGTLPARSVARRGAGAQAAENTRPGLARTGLRCARRYRRDHRF